MSDIWDFLRTGKNTRCGKFRKSCIVQKISSIFAKQMSLPGEPQGSILGGRFQFYSSLIPTRPAVSSVRPSLLLRLRSASLTPCGQGLRSFRLHYAHSAPKSPRLTGGPQNDSGVRSAHNQSQPELPGTSHLPVFRPLVTASKFSSAQRTSSSRIGNRLCPNSVREYSTFGGISEYCRLRISPSISRAFNVSDRTFGDMSGIALAMVLKRVSLFSERTHRISTDHLPENRDRTFRTGQESISVYFRRFSLSSNLLIFNVSYL